MATTIQISNELIERLKTMKMHDKESYEELIWDLIEDTSELSEETKRILNLAEKDVREGRTTPLSEVKKKIGI